MTIQIKPDEKIIAEKLRSGAFRSVDELIHQAIVSLPSAEAAQEVSDNSRANGEKNLAQLFAESPFKGLAIDFERFDDTSSDL